MISSLRGVTVHAEPDALTIEVGGVGLSVAVVPAVARSARIGEPIFLHTALLVREDALSLVGFAEKEELVTFHLLLGVSGVGPKSALGVLSAMTVDQIARAVGDEDDAPFRRVSGIGPKTAKLIVVQLAGKLTISAASAEPSVGGAPGRENALSAALTSLGWPERQAVEVAAEVTAQAPGEATVPELLRQALALLGPARREPTRG